jgi:Flp pilus assembly protein TadG
MTITSLTKTLRRLLRDRSGVAAMELALVAGTLTLAMVNAIEFGRYSYGRMELENAVQMASNAVYETCDTAAELPAHSNCADMSSKITTALQSTNLGNAVILATSGGTSEGYYCITAAGSLNNIANYNVATKPTSCPAGSLAGSTPALYIRINAQYTYLPIFSGGTIASLLPSTVVAGTITRLN